MPKRVYLYGVAGPETGYAVVKYMYIEGDRLSIRHIINDALWLQMKNPTIEHVYAIDDRNWLLWDYREAITKKSVESFSIFKNMLEREGLLII